jgi:hypothetical protein
MSKDYIIYQVSSKFQYYINIPGYIIEVKITGFQIINKNVGK